MYGIYACVHVITPVRIHMCVGTLVGVKIHEHGCRVQKLILNTFPLSLFSSLIPRLAIQLV